MADTPPQEDSPLHVTERPSSAQQQSLSASNEPKKNQRDCYALEMAILSELRKLSNKDEDAASAFGRHVSSRLRRLTPRQNAIACLEINKLLLNIEFPNEPQFPPPSSFTQSQLSSIHTSNQSSLDASQEPATPACTPHQTLPPAEQ